MLKPVLIAIAALVILVMGYAATLPDHFQVERSLVIQAAPEKIFPNIDTLRYWQDWSPWERKDPAMQRTLSGPESGVGAAYAWKGNREVGAGRMVIIESTPASRVRLQLDFSAPFEARNFSEFTLTRTQAGTRVTWRLWGPSPYFSRLMGIFMDMDKMIGADFEAGLAGLKIQSEDKG